MSALSCVTREQLSRLPGLASGTVTLRLPAARGLESASGGKSGLHLGVTVMVALHEHIPNPINRRWNASHVMYEYRLVDVGGRELLTYHWHPESVFLGPDHPHLHVSAALDAQVSTRERRVVGLDKLPLVTGQVSLPTFVRMLITEFGVAPLRSAWRDILDRAEAALTR